MRYCLPKVTQRKDVHVHPALIADLASADDLYFMNFIGMWSLRYTVPLLQRIVKLYSHCFPIKTLQRSFAFFLLIHLNS